MIQHYLQASQRLTQYGYTWSAMNTLDLNRVTSPDKTERFFSEKDFEKLWRARDAAIVASLFTSTGLSKEAMIYG